MKTWPQKVALASVCDVERGSIITQATATLGTVPVIAGGVSPAYFHNTPNRSGNTITVSGSGASAGYVNYWKEPIWASDCSTVRPKDPSNDPRFFYFQLLALSREIAALRTGAAQPHVHARDLARLPVVVPPPAEQRRIVEILDEAFEGIAATVSRTEAAFKNALSLSAATIEWLATGDIPTASVRSVGELIGQGILERISDGNHGEIHPTKNEFVAQGVPFIMASDLRDGRVDQEGCRFIAEDRARSLRVGFARDGDVLLSHKGTIGRVAILSTDRPYVMLTPQVTYYRVRDRTALLPQYLYHALRGRKFQEQLREIADLGSTRAYIGITRQLDLLLTLPSISEQERLAVIFDEVDREAQFLEQTLTHKLALLAELKQSILARAFSGELTREPLVA